ncbi:hypothetical protein K239x_30540 [Planctomycetes bacterium K23_9]|uniref:Uncharacterized protein n=1 Tax=Stieleria marina TaxID=1930275 RepID=A0A517NVB0_9BACT|nr:hypothetical protein K239x_30540 [Planctomycetes bacterium K23_9]
MIWKQMMAVFFCAEGILAFQALRQPRQERVVSVRLDLRRRVSLLQSFVLAISRQDRIVN